MCNLWSGPSSLPFQDLPLLSKNIFRMNMTGKVFMTLISTIILGLSIGFSKGVSDDRFVSIEDTTRIAEISVMASRLQIPYSKQTRNIHILTQEDIRKLPARSIQELLSYVPGVDLRQRGPFGTQADVSIDGGSFDQTMVLINGIKVGDPQTGHHLLSIPVPTEAIERIEIIRGPASRIYGINSLTGAVNIVTKKNLGNSVFVNAYMGSSFKEREEENKKGKYFSESVQVGLSIQESNHQHQLFAGQESTNGHRYNTAADNQKIFYQGMYGISEGHTLQLMGGYIHNAFGANGYYAAPGDKESTEIVKTSFLALQSQHVLSSKWKLSPRLSYRNNKDDYRYLGTKESGRSEHTTQTMGAEVNAVYQSAIGDIGLGIESRFEKIESSNIGNHDRVNHGAYVEYKLEPMPALGINVGAYINYNSDYKWQIFPGIDIGYAITEKFRWVLNAGTSQRLPSFTDLYLSQPGNEGNPDLTSENAFQIETGFKYLGDRIDFQANYFNRRINGFIDWVREDQNAPYIPYNLDGNRTNGINASVRYAVLPTEAYTQLYINGSFNYLDADMDTPADVTSKYAVESLRYQALLGVRLQHGGFSITVANRFHERVSYKSYFLSDARLSYDLNKWNIYMDAQNIANTKYMEAGAVPLPGSWFTLGVKHRWDFGSKK